MFVHLSHKVDPKDQAFPGEAVVTIEKDRTIGVDGKPFNASIIHLPNHFGTHMDAPHHFTEEGIDMSELPVERFAFMGDEVLVVDVSHRNKPEEVILKEDLERYADQLEGKRLVLFRSGFEACRDSDPDTYCNHGLSFHPDMCRYLVEDFPHVDCIGMDWLSIASPSNDYGVDAHHWLLGKYTDNFVTGIEDMSMAALEDGRQIEWVTLGPLRVVGIDSAQVNIMARLAD